MNLVEIKWLVCCMGVLPLELEKVLLTIDSEKCESREMHVQNVIRIYSSGGKKIQGAGWDSYLWSHSLSHFLKGALRGYISFSVS